MEVFNPPVVEPFQFSFSRSSFIPRFTPSTHPCRNGYRFWISRSKLDSTPSSSFRFSFSGSRNLTVSAHFARRNGRRNYLRKKLIEDNKVRIDYPYHRPDQNSEVQKFDEIPEGNVIREIESTSFSDGNIEGTKRRPWGESVLWNKLESWVDQYKKDVELWGVGRGLIFTIFQDSDGNVQRVTINEDEILKRSGVVSKNSNDVSLKILRAKSLAREIENGNNVIPMNSSVAKFVVSDKKSGFLHMIQDFRLHPSLNPNILISGRVLFCGLIVIWALKFLVSFRKREVEYTQLEKEMVRRKVKSREEREMKGNYHLEVVPEVSESPFVFTERPMLNMEELMKNIRQGDSSNSELVLLDHDAISKNGEALEVQAKVEEIREMARRVREIEANGRAQVEGSVDDAWSPEKELNGRDVTEGFPEGISDSIKTGNGHSGDKPVNGTEVNGFPDNVLREGNKKVRDFSALDSDAPSDIRHMEHNAREGKEKPSPSDPEDVIKPSDPLENELRRKPRIIHSVKEARAYLSNMSEQRERDPENPSETESETVLSLDGINGNRKIEKFIIDNQMPEANVNASGETYDPRNVQTHMDDVAAIMIDSLVLKDNGSASSEELDRINDVNIPQGNNTDCSSTSAKQSVKNENWIEKNFDEVEPIVKKIGAGFRDCYVDAREKVNQNLEVASEMSQLGIAEDDDELEWMKDDNLREIVFQVRENELTGRDPFYSMDASDKHAFFEGLEKKVVKENQKLQKLHEFLHSNIENLSYGADGISLYDPPDKIIPRWRGPPMEKNPEVLNNFQEERKAFLHELAGVPHPMKKDEPSSVQESKQAPAEGSKSDSPISFNLRNSVSKNSKKANIVVEGSDGSVRAGKKSGKEYWQHTKKWSRGFLDSYSAETDPEVKSVMKDIGKDLDRWITEKEIQEASDLMNKLPENNKKFIENKLNKIKREMELFGPQAVVSKYKEYAEDKEEDYLWWLDLPHVLCIEIYTMQDDEQKVGFYSLEMAADLELEPKPYHVIAFEDPGDCKNLCYIIQAHMKMLRNGHAFIVARPPKDAFREAKANGFGVTVIKKGEIQLNVDQTLEEVEEQITEIGSKIYHDAIMKDRSVDISALMKGVFGVPGKKPKRRRSKRKLKKPTRKNR
ncbi:hypothetical protein SAY87_030203 [Trapa incisa]|uniref:Embryo defective 1703 n=1 Tax=Trapa incisa TaxID=236973 RepID=A0AAN7KUP4_9MYRT|nr:hypothetical protein SAY87_030203 [Trapa incisa]